MQKNGYTQFLVIVSLLLVPSLYLIEIQLRMIQIPHEALEGAKSVLTAAIDEAASSIMHSIVLKIVLGALSALGLGKVVVRWKKLRAHYVV